MCIELFFADCKVKSFSTAPTQGEVLNIVHEKGNYDLRKAKFYVSFGSTQVLGTKQGATHIHSS